MLLSNIEVLPSKRVIKHLGLVQGSTVRAKHAGRDIMAGFKNIFGGELTAYTELMSEAREEATQRMLPRQKAWALTALLIFALLPLQ